jgi:hypothetical protein
MDPLPGAEKEVLRESFRTCLSAADCPLIGMKVVLLAGPSGLETHFGILLFKII